MKDIQNQPDSRNVPINRVGVKNLRYPVKVLDRTNTIQDTIASVNMFVNLPHNFRGTHMSRFVEILNEYHQYIHIDTISEVLQKMKERLHAEEAHMEIRFPYFIEKAAPVSGSRGLMEYECRFCGTLAEKEDFTYGVKVPVTSLCPCSKEISEAGAHNQRSLINIHVKPKKFIWFEELIEIAENAGSAPLYSLLKRADEKFVTEQAYNNPTFVEDIVRNIAAVFNQRDDISWYRVESENFESIHFHNAYAAVEKSF